MKVLVIGLDGVTLDLIGPWIEAGELPNLQKLIREGASGRLRRSARTSRSSLDRSARKLNVSAPNPCGAMVWANEVQLR